MKKIDNKTTGNGQGSESALTTQGLTLTTLQGQNNRHRFFTSVSARQRLILCALLALSSGCKKDVAPDSPLSDTQTVPIPDISVRPDNEGLAFRFLDRDSGKMRTVGNIADVPEEVRGAVLVFDTNAPPAPPEVLFVANLTTAKEDGSYPYEVRNRFDYERRTVPVSTPSAKAQAASSSVTIYSAEWCGACKQAKAWMKKNNVPFVERDVEKDPTAMDDLKKDAEKAGKVFESIAGRVPVIVAKDKLMTGFDANSLKQILGIP